ncbi:MAG: hypothetical protein HDP34_01995 [Clostridia bacterium]|nr:hypothetical protein [Clostridia bacterium]
MRKNGSRLISIRQYRLTDLFLFAVILVVAEVITFYVPKPASSTIYSFSLAVPIILMVMMRWGWWSVFFAAGDGLLITLLRLNSEGYTPKLFAINVVGNLFIMLLLLAVKFFGKDKIAGKWYFSALFAVLGWVLVFLGKATVSAICGFSFVGALVGQLWDLLSLAIAIIVVLVMRRLDGMFEDQISYLKRIDKERKDKMRYDSYGDEPIDIDEESLSILNKKDDDLY